MLEREVTLKSAPTTARGREAVQRVLDAASALFARQGIRATTLDQVCERSGTGRGQLYLWFAGKPDLVRDVVAQQVERVLAAQQPLLGSISTAADVRDWCERAVAVYEHDDPIRCPIGSLVNELSEADPAARAVLAGGLATWTRHLVTGLERVSARGELAPTATPLATGHGLLAAYQGGVLLSSAAGSVQPLRLALTAVATGALAPQHDVPDDSDA